MHEVSTFSFVVLVIRSASWNFGVLCFPCFSHDTEKIRKMSVAVQLKKRGFHENYVPNNNNGMPSSS